MDFCYIEIYSPQLLFLASKSVFWTIFCDFLVKKWKDFQKYQGAHFEAPSVLDRQST